MSKQAQYTVAAALPYKHHRIIRVVLVWAQSSWSMAHSRCWPRASALLESIFAHFSPGIFIMWSIARFLGCPLILGEGRDLNLSLIPFFYQQARVLVAPHFLLDPYSPRGVCKTLNCSRHLRFPTARRHRDQGVLDCWELRTSPRHCWGKQSDYSYTA